MRNLFILLTLIYSSLTLANHDVRLISVTGLAEKSFQPDIVHLSINIWGKGDSAKKAQANNQVYYEIIKKSVETYKVKKEDIKTTSYQLNPETVYDPKTNRSNIVGYMANQQLLITLRKIDDAGTFVDSLSNGKKDLNGGVSVNSLSFDLGNRKVEENNLLGDAVRNAEAEAEVLAKASKVKIKGVYRLSPVSTSNGPVMFDAAMGRSALMEKGRSAPTEFMSGEVKVNRQVSVEYLVD